MAKKELDPIQVKCSKCGVSAGEPCFVREGDILEDGFHEVRVVAAGMGDTWKFTS